MKDIIFGLAAILWIYVFILQQDEIKDLKSEISDLKQEIYFFHADTSKSIILYDREY